MGRYPLKTTIGRYMNATGDYYSPTTTKIRGVVLNAFEREYARLRESNSELRADPKDWTEREIVAIIAMMRARGLSHNTQAHDLGVVNGLLQSVGNNVIERLKRTRPQVFPKPTVERKGSLSEGELSRILKACEEKQGWTAECIRFVMGMYAYTGMRANELARATLDDLDTVSWTIRVSHPKGERTYGKPRILPIPDPLRPIVQRFLREREKYLGKMGLLEATSLVFPRGKPDKFIDSGSLNNWKIAIRKASGVRFTLHGLRRTYGQNLLNRGVSIETVSLMLGHNSTLTTEKHYCRKNADSARLEVLNALARPETAPSAKTPKLTSRSDLTGYA